MTSRLGLLLLAFAVGASACSLRPAIQPEPPRPCEQLHSQDRCLAMLDVAAAEVVKNRGDVAAIAIVPDPPPEGVTLGAAWPIHVRITLRDGKTHDAKLCGGVSVAAACSEDAHLELGSVLGGYLDITEGSSPLPSIEPSAEDAAEPLVVNSLSIPIDRLGEQEMVLGDGSLPNGLWTTGAAEFPDPWPEDLALRDATVKLELRSLEPDGKPFENAFVHGWRPGVERVRAILVFDVLWFKPGATLKMRNLRVD